MDFENLIKEIQQKLEKNIVNHGNSVSIEESWIINNVFRLFEEYPSGITWAILLNELELTCTERLYHEDRFSTLESVKDSESDVQFENSFELECIDYYYHPLPTLQLKDRRQNTCDLMLHSSYYLLFHSPFDILKHSFVRFSRANLYPKWFLKKKLQFLPTTYFLPTLGADTFFSLMRAALETKDHGAFLILNKSLDEQNRTGVQSIFLRPVKASFETNKDLLDDSSDPIILEFSGNFVDFPNMLDCGQYLIVPYWNTFWEKTTQWQEGMIAIMSSIENSGQSNNDEHVWITGRVVSISPDIISLDCSNGLKEVKFTTEKLLHNIVPGEQIVATSLKQDPDSKEKYTVSSYTNLLSISQLNCPLNSNFLRNDLKRFKNLRPHTQGHIKVLPLQLDVFLNSSSIVESTSNDRHLSFQILLRDQFNDKISASLHPRGTEYQQTDVVCFLNSSEQDNGQHIRTINLADLYPSEVWCDVYVSHDNIISIQKLSFV
ncbi:DNA replication protein Cdc24 [Schizosaccharomyces octosporus yFS286]|uniref:DNA replication protein Cdc24 n=1 Tax=Schizosaccharomyces octosporus (strain yFS286) TaxID=483514 RepID=S9QZ27_SCHOY|nr:DNA replication protein Cdc24 [Schizosaccharomyces octosporus yFS286]EPX71520.1 DNA replication protein Cdc24 [Schizosaccharomyces octosporus yFS286]